MESNETNIIKNSVPPKNLVYQSHMFRFSTIFSNLALTCVTLMLCLLLASLITPLLYTAAIVTLFLFILFIIVFSLGTVFALPKNPVSALWSLLGTLTEKGDSINVILKFCLDSIKWVALTGLIVSAIGIVFQSLNKGKNKILKIVLLSIAVVVFAIVFFLYICSGGIKWLS